MRADSVTVGENAGLSLSIGRNGSIASQNGIVFEAISNAKPGDKNAAEAQKRAGIIAGSARCL